MHSDVVRFFSLAAVVLALGGCGGTPEPTDAGGDAFVTADAAVSCTTAEQCDDGLHCTGIEACTDGVCVSGAAMRCDDDIACTIDSCSEELRRCVSRVPDLDLDGSGDDTCLDAAGVPLGGDCDDDDANRYTGNTEVCDELEHDEDCDDDTHGGIDADGDGFEDAACCNGTSCGDDCNDGRAGSRPDATEVCNLVDDDCDGDVDEEVAIAGFVDADYDGFGSTTARTACGGAIGFSVYDTDCDDANPARNPGQPEICDLLDNDCDPRVDEMAAAVSWYRDVDDDGFGSAISGITISCVPPSGYSLRGTDCDDTTNTRSPAQAELCDGIDNDCSGVADYVITAGDLEDDDRDGIADLECGTPRGRDCNDRDPSSAPGQTESCNGRDDDCDGDVDEDAATLAFFRDADGDGYGSSASGTIVGCVPTAGYVRRGGDCDDANVLRHPDGREGCNASDDDCDGAIDEGEASASCSIAHTAAVCIVGHCREVTCETGYLDCNAGVAGCETDVASSRTTCGSCTNACGAGEGCIAGSCGPDVSSVFVSGSASSEGETIVDLVSIGVDDTVVVGRTPGTLTFGGTSTGLGMGDGFLTRLVSGTARYSVALGGPEGADEAAAVAVDVANDRVYVVGFVQSSTTNLGIPGDASGLPRGYLAAYRLGAGTLVAATRWGGDVPSVGVRLIDVAVSNGVLVVTGWAQGNFVLPSGASFAAGASSDGFVARVDPTTLLDTWTVRATSSTTSTFESLENVAIDPVTNDVYVAGPANGEARLGALTATVTSTGGAVILLGRISSTGTPAWARLYAAEEVASVSDIAWNGSGGLLVTGFAANGFTFGSLVVRGGFLASFAGATGDVRWANGYGGGKGSVRPVAVTTDAARNVYVSGSFYGGADLGAGTIFSNGGNDDVLVLGTTSTGVTRFSFSDGGFDAERAAAVGIDPAGHIVIGGVYASSTQLGPHSIGPYGGVYVSRIDP